MKTKLSRIVDFIKATGALDKQFNLLHDVVIEGFSPISDTRPNTLSWMKSQQLDFGRIEAAAVICSREASLPQHSSIVSLPVEKPRTVFAKVVREFYQFPSLKGIEDTARLGKNCTVGNDVYIGHYTVIGNNVSIGDGTKIYGNVNIYDNVRIGADCIINSGAVIGADGFGYEKDEEGDYFKFPHIGGVLIEDRVEIGSNTCIDRGVLGNTVIRENAKIDNLCHIAHNVVIGRNSMVIAQAMLGGSVVLGKNNWIAPGAVIKNGIRTGDDALVGLGAVVLHDVNANDVVAGVPAKSIKVK